VTFANPADKATILAQGISVAMNTTAYGLIVAIPALVAFAILQNRANDLAEDMNQSALKVYNWLSYSYDPIVTRSTPNKGQRSPEANA
jgi:biopolymer transport protein ExbB/TolQ